MQHSKILPHLVLAGWILPLHTLQQLHWPTRNYFSFSSVWMTVNQPHWAYLRLMLIYYINNIHYQARKQELKKDGSCGIYRPFFSVSCSPERNWNAVFEKWHKLKLCHPLPCRVSFIRNLRRGQQQRNRHLRTLQKQALSKTIHHSTAIIPNLCKNAGCSLLDYYRRTLLYFWKIM